MTVSDDDLNDMIDETILARRTKTMFLRNAGSTLSQISKITGVSIATVRKDLEVVRRDINNEQPMDVIARHRAVIFDIQRANYPAMMKGDKDAAATILRALEREAKLLGLDSPTRVLAAVGGEEFETEAARLIGSILTKDLDTLKELTHDRTSPGNTAIIDAEIVAEADDPAPRPGEPAGVDAGSADPAAGGGGRAPGADGGTAAAPPDGGTDDRAGDSGYPDPLPDDDGWSNL